MKQYIITIKMLVDNTNRNAPSLEQAKDALVDELTPPDMQSYGIVRIDGSAEEVDYCAHHAVPSIECRELHK